MTEGWKKKNKCMKEMLEFQMYHLCLNVIFMDIN